MIRHMAIVILASVLLLNVSLYPTDVHATTVEDSRTWKSAKYTINQSSERVIKLKKSEGEDSSLNFDLPIENVYPNPDIPIILVTTYDKDDVENLRTKEGAYPPPKFWTCESFIIDLTTEKKYPYVGSCSGAISNIWSPDGKHALNGFSATIVESTRFIEHIQSNNIPKIQISTFENDCGGAIDADSWHWVTNNVVSFSGGTCGTFLNYLFYVDSQKTEVYCSKYQKPNYGCRPGRVFLPASEFEYKLMELRDDFNYSKLKSYIWEKRIELANNYLNARHEGDKKTIRKNAQAFIFNILTEKIFPAWLGTPWSFNGTTRTPGEGSIACGFFVTHTLQDVGFKIPSKMGRQPSENIIKNLIGPKDIQRFTNASPMEKVKSWIVENGEGIYIVGLDIHVGFIINKGANITFLHSSYYNPPLKVANQDLMEPSPLTDSKYRILGKILNEKMIETWLTDESFILTYDYFNRQS